MNLRLGFPTLLGGFGAGFLEVAMFGLFFLTARCSIPARKHGRSFPASLPSGSLSGGFQGAGMPDMTGLVSGLCRFGSAPPGVRGAVTTKQYGLQQRRDNLPNRPAGGLRSRVKYPPQGIRQARLLPLRGLLHA